MSREHFRILYERNPADVAVNPDAAKAIFDAAIASSLWIMYTWILQREIARSTSQC